MFRRTSFSLLTSLLVLAVCTSASGQASPTDAGSRMWLGSFAYSSAGGDLYEEDGDRFNLVQINPSLTYFTSPGLGLGGKLVLARMSIGNDSQTSWALGPQLLYVVGGRERPAAVKGMTFSFVGMALLYSRTSSSPGDHVVSGTMFSFGGGFCSMLTNTVGLIVEGAYEIDNLSSEGESASGNKFNIGAGLAVFLY